MIFTLDKKRNFLNKHINLRNCLFYLYIFFLIFHLRVGKDLFQIKMYIFLYRSVSNLLHIVQVTKGVKHNGMLIDVFLLYIVNCKTVLLQVQQ